jgi:hypothetical protein
VASITGIRHLFNFEEASIAQKFSWASERETTRIEDTAYCLVGIFGVNMALLYVDVRSHPRSRTTLGRDHYVMRATGGCLNSDKQKFHAVIKRETNLS